MITIGELLKSARVAKKYSLSRVEEMTRIKSEFIKSIEDEKWEKLPPFPTVLGFVKSLAGVLGVNDRTAVAILKRDYPPKKLNINPKPDVSGKQSWSPKLTFALGVGLILVIVFGYLIFQYTKFVSPPSLSVESPKEGQNISESSVVVFGATDSDVKLTINGQPVLVDEEGKFSVSLEITDQTNEIVVIATSRSGKSTEVHRTIVPTGL